MGTDSDILKQLSEGSRRAFETIFHKHYAEILVYTRSIFPDEAEEITQQTFIKLWEKRSDAHKIQAIRPYLFRSAYNACINAIEHEKVKNKYINEAAYRLRNIGIDIFEDTLLPDLSNEIENATKHLPPKNREVFKLRYFDLLSNEDIAEKLEMSKRTVENHLYNALKILREKLKHLLVLIFLLKIFPF